MTSHKNRPTWRRCMLALAMGTGVGLAVGCASDRGVATQDAIDTAIQEAVTPVPQVAQPFAVLPKPVVPAPAAALAPVALLLETIVVVICLMLVARVPAARRLPKHALA